MKQSLFFLLSFLLCVGKHHAQEELNYYGTAHNNDNPKKLLRLSTGNYCAVGKVADFPAIHLFDCQARLIDSVKVFYLSTTSGAFNDALELPNGEILVVGDVFNGIVNGEQMALARFDAQLNVLKVANWSPGGSTISKGRALVMDQTGRVFVAGESPGLTIDFSNIFWQEIDPHTLQAIGNPVIHTDGVDYVNDAESLPDGNFLITGYSTWGNIFDPENAVICRSYVMKINQSGQKLWKRNRDELVKNKYGASYFRKVIVGDADGAIMVAGRSFTGDTLQNQFDAYFEVLDSSGVFVSSLTVPMAGNQQVYDFVEANLGAGLVGLAVGDSAQIGSILRYPVSMVVGNFNGPVLVSAESFADFPGHSARAAAFSPTNQLSVAGRFDVGSSFTRRSFFFSGEQFSVSIHANGGLLTASTINEGQVYSYQWYLNGQPISGAVDSVLTLSDEGNYSVVVTGEHGCPNSATYSFVPSGSDTAPLFWLSYDTLCSQAQMSIESVVNDAATYSWDFGDGQTSAAKNPMHVFGQSGTYQVELCITTSPGQVMVDTIEILDHESANFFESLFEGDPDVYFILKNQNGTEVYRSQIQYNADVPIVIPCAVLLSNQSYLIELKDYDLLDTDDDLGEVFLVNPVAGGTFSFGGVTIRFNTSPAAASYCFEQEIAVVSPTITYDESTNLLTAHPGNAIYHWYLNGVEITGQTDQTLTPVGSGSYTVELVSGFCNQVSPPYVLGNVDTKDLYAENLKLSVYPNPNSGNCWVQLPQGASLPNGIAQVYDATGRIVFSQNMDDQTFVDRFELKWPDAQTGVYQLLVPGFGAQKLIITR
ncbi:MAG: PKD domain-containing protein [Saprospiraceae bacterium]|nr:PKD domain-containing protein [Saprospiraceae bacterium]